MVSRAYALAMDDLSREAERLARLAQRVPADVWREPAGAESKERIDGTLRDAKFVIETYRETGGVPRNPQRSLRAVLVIRDWMRSMSHHCENLIALQVGVSPRYLTFPEAPRLSFPAPRARRKGKRN